MVTGRATSKRMIGSIPMKESATIDRNSTEDGGGGAIFRRKASISEVVTEVSKPECYPPAWFASVFEFPFRVKNQVTGVFLPEATGWAMDSAGRGPLNQVGGYVGTAVLRMAIREAGCRDCRIRVGLKASSLLTFTSAVVGVATALVMPFVGAVVDHTSHRKLFGTLTALFTLIFTGLYMAISDSSGNWRFILLVDSLQSFFALIHATGSFAYLPDLSTNEEAIVRYTSSFGVRQYTMQLAFSIAALAFSFGLDRAIASSVQLARYASALAFGIGSILLFYSWIFLFRPRPALSKVPEGDTLWTTGFRQVKATTSTIVREYRALKWFMISILWSPEHGAGVILSIVISWLTAEAGFTGRDVAITNVVLVATSVPGAMLSRLIVRRIDVLNSYRLGLFCFGCIIAVTVTVVNGPGRRNAVFGLASAWGTILGWTYSSQRVLLCTLIPKGQELELMGLFTFLGQILGWLPPLLVTIMHERGITLRFSLLLEAGFCFLAVVCTMPMGDYKKATAFAAARSQEKLNEVSLAARRSTTTGTVIAFSTLSHQQAQNDDSSSV